MSETRLTGTDTPQASAAGAGAPARSGWTGWIVFAAVIMLLLGFFQAIKGLAAIVNPDFFADTGTRPAFDVDHAAYGWVHLALGVAIFLAGIGVLSGNAVARVVGVALAAISAVGTLPDLTVAPVWGLLIIVVDLLVIYALVVHGREMTG